MTESNLIDRYENFRSLMVTGINNLEIDEVQKRIFIISLQTSYLQMLLQIPSDLPVVDGELVNSDLSA